MKINDIFCFRVFYALAIYYSDADTENKNWAEQAATQTVKHFQTISSREQLFPNHLHNDLYILFWNNGHKYIKFSY